MDAKVGIQTWHEMMALILNLHHEPHRLFHPEADASSVRRSGVWKNGAPVTGNSLTPGEFTFGHWRLVYNEKLQGFEKYNGCDS